MKKSEMFGTLLGKVCEVCEVRRDTVIGGTKLQAVVDARVLAVQYLRRIGLSSDDIALLVLREQNSSDYFPSLEAIKVKAKGIDRMFRSYSDRCLQSYAFCLMSKEIADWCRGQYSELYGPGMKQLPGK